MLCNVMHCDVMQCDVMLCDVIPEYEIMLSDNHENQFNKLE